MIGAAERDEGRPIATKLPSCRVAARVVKHKRGPRVQNGATPSVTLISASTGIAHLKVGSAYGD